MYHNLPDDEPDNEYIKFVEEITNANFCCTDKTVAGAIKADKIYDYDRWSAYDA